MKKPSKAVEYVPYILMAFSIIECGVGLSVATFTETAITGSWWIIFFVFPVSWMVILVDSQSALTSFLLFSMMVVEAAWSSNLDLLVVCGDTATGELYGNKKYAENALYCSYLEGQADCSCAKTYADSYSDLFSPNSTLIAEETDSNKNYRGCIMIDTSKSETCGEILTSYRDQVRASVTFLALLFVGMLIITSASCNRCCHKEGAHRVVPSSDDNNNGGGQRYVVTEARYAGGSMDSGGGRDGLAPTPTVVVHAEVVRRGGSGFGGGFDGVRHEFLPPPENNNTNLNNNYNSRLQSEPGTGRNVSASVPTVVAVTSPTYIQLHDVSAQSQSVTAGSASTSQGANRQQNEVHDVVYVHATPI